VVLPQGQREIALRWGVLASAWQQHFGEGLTPPSGSFYCWLHLPPEAEQDPMAFCVRLRDEAKVVLVPGSAFGEAGRDYARLSFAASPEQIQEGIRRLAPYWRRS
jgi:aspartate/methionine/tyrosine aminotransferase